MDTRDVFVSPLTEGNQNAYDLVSETSEEEGEKAVFEIYHLQKRGKQHIQAGHVLASTPHEAMSVARQQLKTEKLIYNIWAIRSSSIRYTNSEESDLWLTLPEKKFRDAAEYKGGEKLKVFLEKSNSN